MGTSVNVVVTDLVVTDDVVAVEVNAWIEGIPGSEYSDMYIGKGASRRDPGDKIDVETGVKLAVGRALRSLGRGILAEGQERVRQADHIKKRQAEATRQKNLKKQANDLENQLDGFLKQHPANGFEIFLFDYTTLLPERSSMPLGPIAGS